MDDRDAANWADQGYRESCKDEKCDKTMCFLGVTHAIKRAVESETRELHQRLCGIDPIVARSVFGSFCGSALCGCGSLNKSKSELVEAK